MNREERAEFTNMVMVYDEQNRILVEDRVDPDWPGVVFPGGHIDPGESLIHAAIREVYEETGLTIESPRLCGVKQFQKDNGARYVVFLHKTNRFSGELHSSEEGEVFWLDRARIGEYRCVDQFAELLQVFESEELSEFYFDRTGGGWEAKLY